MRIKDIECKNTPHLKNVVDVPHPLLKNDFPVQEPLIFPCRP